MASKRDQEDADFALALQLQASFDEDDLWRTVSNQNKAQDVCTGILDKNASTSYDSIIDESWEINDPNPDIHNLFLQFNNAYFWGKLDGIEVRWSRRMTLCAGLCCYEGRGGLCSVRLSQPLLKFRPRKDLVQTLLHEMIHAYLFVTCNNKDHDAHGPEFLKHMHRINKKTGAKITVYHNFHDEVDEHRKHWWRCNGPCRKHPPFFGYVKRAMNRAPSHLDPWWSRHKSKCNGDFIKVKEPESKKSFGKKIQTRETSSSSLGFKKKSGIKDIRGYIAPSSSVSKILNKSDHFGNSSGGSLGMKEHQIISSHSVMKNSSSDIHTYEKDRTENTNSPKAPAIFIPFSGKGYSLNSTLPLQITEPHSSALSSVHKPIEKDSKDSNPSKLHRTFIPFSGKGYSLNSNAVPSELVKPPSNQSNETNTHISSSHHLISRSRKNLRKSFSGSRIKKGYAFKTSGNTATSTGSWRSRTIVLPQSTSTKSQNISSRKPQNMNKQNSPDSIRESHKILPGTSHGSARSSKTSSESGMSSCFNRRNGGMKSIAAFFARNSDSKSNKTWQSPFKKPENRTTLPRLKRRRIEVPESSNLRKNLKDIFSSDSEEEKEFTATSNMHLVTNVSKSVSSLLIPSSNTVSIDENDGQDFHVACPVCGIKVLESAINNHLDECLL